LCQNVYDFKILFDMSKCLWFLKIDYIVNVCVGFYVYFVMFNSTIMSFQINYNNMETHILFNLLIVNLMSLYGQLWLIPRSLESKCKGHKNHVFVVLCWSIKNWCPFRPMCSLESMLMCSNWLRINYFYFSLVLYKQIDLLLYHF
jgi:hypothetical protein